MTTPTLAAASPYQTQIVSAVNNGTTTTVTIEGGWVWFTHGDDCNTDRAGVGYAIDWNDPNDPGFHVTTIGSTSIDVGSTLAVNGNTVDNTVHPSAGPTGTYAVAHSISYPPSPDTSVSVSDPSQFANWRGGCGIDNFVYQGKDEPQGVWGPISHTYLNSGLPSSICALTYDVHAGTKVNDSSNGLGIPANASEITAGGSNRNTDNSAESNGQTPAGNVCATIPVQATPSVSTQLSSSSPVQTGATVHDQASLTGESSNAGGTISYAVYSSNTCSSASKVQDLTPSSNTVSGSTVPASKSITLSTAGTYYFQATYSGDSNNVGASSACTSEQLVVNNPPTSPPSGGGGGGGTPAISITKNPKGQSVNSGGTANWTIVVTNTGTLTLSNVSVSDPIAPNCNASGSSNSGLGSMAPGASVTYNCSLANVTAGFTNVATATGTGSNGQTVSAQDSAPVTVVTPAPTPTPPVTHPAISIVKGPKSQSIAVGGTAHFTITVTNTGDVTLSDVTVSDPLSSDCNHNIGTLDVGKSASYTCTKTNVPSGFENVATATGKPPTGSSVKATDHATIQVAAVVPPQRPAILISKGPKHQTVTTTLESTKTTSGATNTTVTYGSARFLIKVTNHGNVPLHSVKVTDPLSPGCNKAIGNLGVGASMHYSCTKASVTRAFTNTATATGISPKGVHVSATDHANVAVTTKTTSTSGAQFTG